MKGKVIKCVKHRYSVLEKKQDVLLKIKKFTKYEKK